MSFVFFVVRFVGWSIRWTAATVFFLAVMAGAGYFVFMEILSGGQHVTVPNIVDLPITEASLVLAEQGLELGKQAQVPHPTVPKYHVITQRPAAGRVVRTGRRVHPTVSMGADFLITPDLLHTTLEEARRAITQSRFRAGTVARVPHKTPRDTVIAQDPAPGQYIPNQGSIHLLASAGTDRQSAFMPDILGKDVQEVLRILSPLGVTVVPNEVDSEGVLEDVVLNQHPPPGTLVYEGQLVTYDVKPSGTIALPDTRYRAEVRHAMRYDWFDRDVRVDIVDRRGNRQTAWSKPPLFDAMSKRTYIAGSAIRIPVTYTGEVSVEIYINGQLVESYYLSEGADPVKNTEPPV